MLLQSMCSSRSRARPHAGSVPLFVVGDLAVIEPGSRAQLALGVVVEMVSIVLVVTRVRVRDLIMHRSTYMYMYIIYHIRVIKV